MPLPDDLHSPFWWIKQILKSSRRVDEASTGTIVGATGASLVFGLFTGGFCWIPFGTFASILIYRSARFYEQRDIRLARQRLEIAEIERQELEAIEKSNLTPAQKLYLTEKLTAPKSLPAGNDQP